MTSIGMSVRSVVVARSERPRNRRRSSIAPMPPSAASSTITSNERSRKTSSACTALAMVLVQNPA